MQQVVGTGEEEEKEEEEIMFVMSKETEPSRLVQQTANME